MLCIFCSSFIIQKKCVESGAIEWCKHYVIEAIIYSSVKYCKQLSSCSRDCSHRICLIWCCLLTCYCMPNKSIFTVHAHSSRRLDPQYRHCPLYQLSANGITFQTCIFKAACEWWNLEQPYNKANQAVVKYKFLIFQGTSWPWMTLFVYWGKFWRCLQIGTTLGSSSKWVLEHWTTSRQTSLLLNITSERCSKHGWKLVTIPAGRLL